jgi:hypothetical protein
MNLKQLVEWELAREIKYSEKTCSSAILFITNRSWPDPGLSPGRHDQKPAANRLSYDTAR